MKYVKYSTQSVTDSHTAAAFSSFFNRWKADCTQTERTLGTLSLCKHGKRPVSFVTDMQTYREAEKTDSRVQSIVLSVHWIYSHLYGGIIKTPTLTLWSFYTMACLCFLCETWRWKEDTLSFHKERKEKKNLQTDRCLHLISLSLSRSVSVAKETLPLLLRKTLR